MESFTFEFKNKNDSFIKNKAVLVGVVGSGNVEVLIEPTEQRDAKCYVYVNTSVSGYGETWERVVSDFIHRNSLNDVFVHVNDGGASPAVVSLRLDQAAAQYCEGDN